MREVTRCNAVMLPVDSEHSAIFQVFEQNNAEAVEKIILTASGGPFRQQALAEMAEMTPEQAVAHPNWCMGAKISVDSATMMNKGLELIEAHHLFGCRTSGSRSWSIRSRSSTAWSPIATARCWRSSAARTCARRSPMRWAGPSASQRPPIGSTSARSGS